MTGRLVTRWKFPNAAAAALLLCFCAGEASAQVGFGQPGPPQPTPQKPPPGMETHAAAGADDANKVQTQEPSLPPDPLAIPPSVQKRIGTDTDEDKEIGVGPKVRAPWRLALPHPLPPVAGAHPAR